MKTKVQRYCKLLEEPPKLAISDLVCCGCNCSGPLELLLGLTAILIVASHPLMAVIVIIVLTHGLWLQLLW